MLPKRPTEPVVFVGGEKYVPLFCSLTSNVASRRIVFHNCAKPPAAVGCELRRFWHGAEPQRNWHYSCARALMRGEIDVASS